jgi:anti-sigma factor RsiW
MHYSDGRLRAYDDNELPAHDAAHIAQHLATCNTCRQRYQRIATQQHQLHHLFASPDVMPDTQTAYQRMQHHITAQSQAVSNTTHRRNNMNNNQPTQHKQPFYRGWVIALVSVMIVVGLLALPPVRAIADQFLQIFRVQNVLFVPMSSEHMAKLDSLDFDKDMLFVSEPTVIAGSKETHAVDSIADASDALGFTAKQVTQFHTTPITTDMRVKDAATLEFQVNVDGIRSMLDMMEVADVTIPDALGEQPVVVDMSPMLVTHYEHTDYQMGLVQGTIPNVSLPDGVDLSQVGEALLRLLGMTEDEATQLSKTVDWRSTLVVPFPSDLEAIRQVTINGQPAILTEDSGRRAQDNAQDNADDMPHHRRGNHMSIYWQEGNTFYVLLADGRISSEELVVAAETLQ